MSERQVDDFRFEIAALGDREDSDGHRQLKAARAAGAGVEIEHALLRVEVRDMGVAVEDGREFGCCGVEVQSFEVVQHIEVAIVDEDYFGLRQLGTITLAIDVAAHGGDGSHFGELVEDGDFADVAEVKDAIDTAKGGSDFGAEEAVRVADDAKAHEFRMTESLR